MTEILMTTPEIRGSVLNPERRSQTPTSALPVTEASAMIGFDGVQHCDPSLQACPGGNHPNKQMVEL